MSARSCRKKFLGFFPKGFRDPTYLAWERDYKEAAHVAWLEALGRKRFRALLDAGQHADIAATAVRIESRTNLLFSFEKMALRDAVATDKGARAFAEGLYDWLHGSGTERAKFERWVDVVAELPRRQTRVLTWPVLTVFGFVAKPDVHVFLKPMVTRRAAVAYGYDLAYSSRPTWETYGSLLAFADTVRRDLADLKPRDMIDVQSFLWVQGSDEYA
ncbi:MAG: hypothetical protein QOE45_1409 [Frankiaceae bacterium]|jgi:hypothetical protein|nr:hypothetical protein [Frankiaceae bacterium]